MCNQRAVMNIKAVINIKSLLMIHVYRKQSIDLHSKSVDRFLYGCNTNKKSQQ